MKKLITKGNKVLAVCLTIMMVITSCVFFAPANFAANAADEECVHEYTKEVTKEATCRAEGEITYTCSLCGDVYTEATVINPDNHADATWLVGGMNKPATHTETGKQMIECPCGFKDYIILPIVPDHVWDYLNVEEATCTKEGYADARICTICYFYEQNVVLEKLPHTVVNVEAIAATCTEDGKTAGSYCSVCDEVIDGFEVIPALGHKEVADKGFAATCTEDGLTDGSHCSVCGEAMVAQEVIPAKGHTDNNKNGYCDECHKLYCECFHHKIFTSKFYKVIYKIVIVVWKLLGVNQKCECGQSHYLKFGK